MSKQVQTANETNLLFLDRIMKQFEQMEVSANGQKTRDLLQTPFSAGRPDVYECRSKRNLFMLTLWPIIDKLFYCLVPFLFLIVSNLLIIRNISKAEKMCQVLKLKISYTNKPRAGQQASQANRLPAPRDANSCGKKPADEGYLLPNSHRPNEFWRERKKQLKRYHLVNRRFTIMLLSLSFAFLLLTLPVVIMFLFLEYFDRQIESMTDLSKSTASYEWLRKAQKISTLLMYLNHSINFFSSTSPPARAFRQQFYRNFVNSKCVAIKIKPNAACMDIKKNIKLVTGGGAGHNRQKQMELKLKSSLYD